MTPQETDKHLKRIQNYLRSTYSGTQFYDACKIAEDALYEVKKLNKLVVTGQLLLSSRREIKTPMLDSWMDRILKSLKR